jgi:ComF family protein
MDFQKPMKNLFSTIFDLIFPRRKNDAVIFDISPADFYQKIPRWSNNEIFPLMKAIFRYKDRTAKAMIKELKSSESKHAARIAAYALANHFKENRIRDAMLIPIPISKKRRKKRGYNQCEFILDFFMREMRARGDTTAFFVQSDILERPIDAPKSALKDRAGRLKAAEGIFRTTCTLSNIKKRIIVIDDVITTGSTMHSAIATLRAAGAENVSGVGIAH